MQVAEIWTVLVWRSLHRVIIESRGFRDTVIYIDVQHVIEDVNYSTMKTDVHTTQNNKIMSLWYWCKLIRNIIIIVMYFFFQCNDDNQYNTLNIFLNELFRSCVYVDIICIYKNCSFRLCSNRSTYFNILIAYKPSTYTYSMRLILLDETIYTARRGRGGREGWGRGRKPNPLGLAINIICWH